MYIKEIKISNFRNFKVASVPFHEGVNVIIGHNNTGKSNLLRAMGLVLGYSDGHRLCTSDLFYETDVATLQLQSPRIQITLVLHRSEGEALDSAEMGLFSGMMTDPALSEEAELNYEFKLAEAQEENYKADVAGATTAKEIWKIIIMTTSDSTGAIALEVIRLQVSTSMMLWDRLISSFLMPFVMSVTTYTPVIIRSLGMC